MYSPQCHGPCLSASTTVRNSTPVMRSTLPSDPPSDASAEAGTSRQGIVTPSNQHHTQQRRPLSPSYSNSQRPRTPISLSQSPGSGRLKRRASQGSLLTKPSSVSRFLSRSSASFHPPSVDISGSVTKSYNRTADFHTNSIDSRLRISTASSSLAARTTQSSPRAWESTGKDEYPATLPPTPPEDDDHIAWSPRNNMLLFESHINRDPGLIPMDEGPNMDTTSGTMHSDTLGSPSDNISPSSSGGSPQSSSGDMDCDPSSWLESSVQATCKFSFGCVIIQQKSQKLIYVPSVVVAVFKCPRGSRQNCLPNASISKPSYRLPHRQTCESRD